MSVDASGWGGGTLTRVSVTGFERSTAAQYTAGSFASTAATDTGAIVEGLPFTVAVAVRSNVFPVHSGTIYIEWLTSGGSGFGYPSAPFTLTAGVVSRVSVTATAPSGAVACRGILDGINFSVTPADITETLIEQTSSLLDYFDGDSASAVWDGVPGLSSSTLADVVSGTAHLTLPALTADLVGTAKDPGRLAMTLPHLTVVATGRATLPGALVARLPALTADLSGRVLPPSGVIGRPPARLASDSRPVADLAGGSEPLATLQGGEA
ncbi:hypothetical protein [Streptosporangium sp. NPDC020145]|uniref:hypothetical protein n=1 Tax=Streptosporangium sp. NPDC020145 TaxID=3154694 RepID=UPI00341C1416